LYCDYKYLSMTQATTLKLEPKVLLFVKSLLLVLTFKDTTGSS